MSNHEGEPSKADVYEAGRVQGVIDAARHHANVRDLDPAALLMWVVSTPPTEPNPYEDESA